MGNEVTRFPNGISDRADGHIFADMPFLDPTKFHIYYNDFDAYVAGDWVVTETQVAATQALAAGDGGILALVNSAANNDLNALQKTPSGFLLEAGKRAAFAIRLSIDDASLAAFVAGLQVIDTTPLDVTDGIYFLKSAGSTAIQFIARKDASTGSNSNTNIGTITTSYVTLSWYYDGIDKVIAAINGVPVASLSAAAAYLPDTITTVSFALSNGSAVARTMNVDFVYAAKER